MSDRRAPRLALEVAFLAALAAALTFADLRAYEIAGIEFLGWLIAAVFEWGALRARAHYGSGIPPRWYVPQTELPPPRPLEQFARSSAAAFDEATWIASPAELADWPVAEKTVIETRVEEETQIHDVLEVELAIAVAAAQEAEPAEEVPAPVVSTARHRVDPFEEAAPARRFRRHRDERAFVEVSARPSGPRSLPRSSRDEG